MDTPDAWGLMPAPSDPAAVDVELGHTTSDDTDPWSPAPVTRSGFVSLITAAGMRRLWTLGLQWRARRWTR